MGAKALGSLVAIAAGLLFAAVALPQESLQSTECLVGSAADCEALLNGECLIGSAASCEVLVSVAAGGGGGSGDCMVISGTLNPTETTSSDDFVNLADHTKTATTETSELDYMIPVGMTASNLIAWVNVAPGNTDGTFRVTLRDDQADTDLTCDIVNTDVECTNTADTATLVSGSVLTVSIDTSPGTIPSGTSELNFAFCMEET